MYTPEIINNLKPNEIIVFGSNWQGNHAGGLAKICIDNFGAIEWQADGLQWQSYAINTMDWIDKIKEWLEWLVKFANKETRKIIYLTKIWCGIAGYSEEDIKKLLPDFPANVILPKWW